MLIILQGGVISPFVLLLNLIALAAWRSEGTSLRLRVAFPLTTLPWHRLVNLLNLRVPAQHRTEFSIGNLPLETLCTCNAC